VCELIYSTGSSIYKGNKSCDRLTDGRSPSVGPVVLTDHKWALAIRQARCRSVTKSLANVKKGEEAWQVRAQNGPLGAKTNPAQAGSPTAQAKAVTAQVQRRKWKMLCRDSDVECAVLQGSFLRLSDCLAKMPSSGNN
jgi:hypothetical protein